MHAMHQRAGPHASAALVCSALQLDQALLLLSTAVLKAPHETEAWFALAGACARKVSAMHVQKICGILSPGMLAQLDALF